MATHQKYKQESESDSDYEQELVVRIQQIEGYSGEPEVK